MESLEVRLHRPWVLAYPTSVIEEILYVEVYIMGYIPELTMYTEQQARTYHHPVLFSHPVLAPTKAMLTR